MTNYKQLLTIIRGCPGSGKSTYAKSLNIFHVEADQYFTNHKGEYNWEGSKVKHAHNWCFQTTVNALLSGVDVVVSNTFTRISEMQKYIDFCNAMNISFKVICCKNNFGNVHSVPEETLINMKARWEDFEGEEIV